MMESEKLELRVNVKFLTKLGWKGTEIIKALHNVYGDNCPTDCRIYEWIRRFKEGRESIEDDPREGRPSTSTNDESVDAVRSLVEQDRRLSVEVIAHEVGISFGSADTILKDRLGLSKLSARWVPKALRDDQKAQRADCALHFLNQFDADPPGFLNRIVTGDETWLYQYDPENKVQSKQWLPTGGSGPIKFKGDRSVKKLMATIFWDAEGVVLVDFLHDQRTVTGPYYAEILRKLSDALRQKRPGKLHHRVLFHHDNAPAHTSHLSRAVLREYRWEILPHPPYSPDLAPSDFFLFPKLKENIKGVHWESISSVESAVLNWFSAQNPAFFRDGLERWRHRMEKCLTVDGSYVEK